MNTNPLSLTGTSSPRPIQGKKITANTETQGAPEAASPSAPSDVFTEGPAAARKAFGVSVAELATSSFDSLHQIAGIDLSGSIAAKLAQVGVRAMESVDGQQAKAKMGEAFLKFFAVTGFDEQAAKSSQSLLEQTSPTASGAASAYLTSIRNVAMRGAESVPGTGFDMEGRDLSVSPKDDFYQHNNGGWIEKNPIPADKTKWSRFNELRDASTRIQGEILKEYASSSEHPAGSIEQKLGDFYYSALDTASIEAAGLQPIAGLIESIDSVSDMASLQKSVVQLHNAGISAFFSFGSVSDAHDSTQQIGGAYQGGLGLSGKDDYLKTDEKSVQTRADYVDHIATMLGLMGQSPESAKTDAQSILALETKLAEASLSRAEARDPNATYNVKDREALGQLTPAFDWNSYLDGRGASEAKSINVGMPKFFEALDKTLTETPISDLKAYMKWNLINRTANYLPARFDEADFEFYGKKIGGAKEREPREKRMSDLTNDHLGMALGKAYVDRAFPPEAKKRAEEMIEHIRGAIGEHVTSLAWMGEDTKAQALDKLGKVRVKVGYPDKWESFDDLSIERGVHGNNVMRAKAYEEAQDIAKIGQPVDRSEWHMTPSTVNAYYSPSGNEIVFPAAILQPPFFDANADDAINYGGIGVVIGHEFTHGFDDKGSKFDGDGNLRNWWSDDDKAQFQERAGAVKEQARTYEVKPGLHHNPDLVLGEALADLGGATLSLTALQNSLKGKGFDQKVEGFTPEQRFFQGFGQIWAGNSRDEAIERQIATDPHPVAPFRVNQTLKNVPAFGAAFEVDAQDPMALPEDKRAHLW